MKNNVTLFLILLSPLIFSDEITLNQLRMDKRFGIGLSAAGPLSLLGIEFDFNLTEEISITGGIGTGLDYSTLAFKGKYFFLGKSVSPYFGFGFARWWANSTPNKQLSPSVLANKFIKSGSDIRDGFSVWMFYPAIGVQFMHPLGLAFYAEAQYLFKLFSFANGTYAGLGVQWYF